MLGVVGQSSFVDNRLRLRLSALFGYDTVTFQTAESTAHFASAKYGAVDSLEPVVLRSSTWLLGAELGAFWVTPVCKMEVGIALSASAAPPRSQATNFLWSLPLVIQYPIDIIEPRFCADR
ncbi:MAG: hypothetical protein QM820_04665 [Minicystis sp.]